MAALWFEQVLLPDGWAQNVRVSVEAGRIDRVETGVATQPGDERHAIVLPGLANLHCHGFQRGMASLSEFRGAPDDDFWSWRDIMYRFLDRLTPEDVAAINALAFVEMMESGFTRVAEFHYLHNDADGRRYADPAETAGAVIAAAEESGIGLTLLPVFYAHGDFGGAPPAPGQRRFLSDIDGFATLVEASRSKLPADAGFGIAPHSLRAVTAGELAAILPLAGDGPIHIHAAEQMREVDASLKWSGQRPVEWLLNNADVDARWCLVHATHLTDDECDRLAASGAVAGLCPVTEANLGDGIFPATRYLAAGGAIGIGTDSNILIDAAGELRALEYSQRLRDRRRAMLGSEAVRSIGERLFREALVERRARHRRGHRNCSGPACRPLHTGDRRHRLRRCRYKHDPRPLGLRRARKLRRLRLARRAQMGFGRAPCRARRRRRALPPHGRRPARMSFDARIRAAIEGDIRSGTLRPGDKLPSEHELAALHGCARATVSKAMAALHRAGLIERRRKAGSFVADQHVHSAVLEVPDLAQLIEARGHVYRWQLLSRELAGTEVRIRGLHCEGDTVIAIETRSIVVETVPDAATERFDDVAPGTWLLAHIPWTSARHRIRAAGASAEEAHALGIAENTACLILERSTWRGEAAVTTVRQIFRGDMFDMVAHFEPSRG
ncbi:formimidoylglutamate deiminase [Sphingopyxis sp. PET50]|uniref:formimidoylglutamate deiminase n=1 Tax=Sphingopyxis sp. PET50 TaxID=2976533 RepID=UPI00391A6C39